jgi:hypothetical protein
MSLNALPSLSRSPSCFVIKASFHSRRTAYTSRNGPIDAQLFPSCLFITTPVNLSMMAAPQGNCELVADLAAKRDPGPDLVISRPRSAFF